MRKILFIPLFVLISCFTLEAADFYLMYDPNCMNRLVYRSQVGNEMIKYSLQLNDNEQVMLEVGTEDSGNTQSFLPRQAFRCGNSFISDNLTGILQNKMNNVYLVKPAANNAYQIIPVRSYDYYLQEGNYLVYNGQQFRFSYSPSLATVGQDLSSNDPRGRVQFEGKIKYVCADALLFKQSSDLDANSNIDIIFVPQLGVVEQKSPQFNNTLQLVQVNNMATNTFFQQQYCNQSQTNATAGITDYSSGAFNTQFNSQTQQDDLMNRGQQQQQTAEYHTVEKGETLFGIARKYNVKLEDLKSWNDIPDNSSFIRTGKKLRVGTISNEFASRSVATYEAPFPDRPMFNQNTGLLPAWKTTSGIHIVKPGENIVSIAQMYGYTVERFSDFNNLAPNSQLNEGQTLKTTDCDILNSNNSTGAINNYNTNTQLNPSIQPTMPNYQITNPSTQAPAQNNSTYDNTYFSRGAQENAYQYSQPSTNVNTGTSKPQSDAFEPYSIFSESEANTNTSNNNNLNVSPSQYGNTNTNTYTPNASFGSPVPNTAVPQTNSSGNAREPFRDLNSPVPGVNTNTPSSNNNLERFNVSPPQNNTQQNFTMGGTTDYYNNTNSNAKRISHIVKQGETMETIARKYNIPLQRLLDLNRMKQGESVLPDQRIYLN